MLWRAYTRPACCRPSATLVRSRSICRARSLLITSLPPPSCRVSSTSSLVCVRDQAWAHDDSDGRSSGPPRRRDGDRSTARSNPREMRWSEHEAISVRGCAYLGGALDDLGPDDEAGELLQLLTVRVALLLHTWHNSIKRAHESSAYTHQVRRSSTILPAPLQPTALSPSPLLLFCPPAWLVPSRPTCSCCISSEAWRVGPTASFWSSCCRSRSISAFIVASADAASVISFTLTEFY